MAFCGGIPLITKPPFGVTTRREQVAIVWPDWLNAWIYPQNNIPIGSMYGIFTYFYGKGSR